MESPILPATAKAAIRNDGLTAFRWLRHLTPNWGEMVGVAVFLAAVIAWLSIGSTRSAPKPDTDVASGGAGIIVRSEVTHLWLPETLRALASLQSSSSPVRNHEDLRQFLEQRQRLTLQYAMTVRGHQVNGRHSDITFIRRPYEDPRCFQELLDILAIADGKPGRVTALDFTVASVHVIADERLSREPSEIIAELERSWEGQR